MLEDVEVSRSLMKRMKSTGEMTEPWGTPALIEGDWRGSRPL